MIIINKVILIGRLANDPELRFTASGKAVATFRIAVDRPFKKDEADFFNVVVWGNSAEACSNYTKKGRLVAIDGRLQSRTYENKEGQKRYVTEVVANQVEFLEWGDKDNQQSNNSIDGKADIDMSEFEAMDGSEDLPF